MFIFVCFLAFMLVGFFITLCVEEGGEVRGEGEHALCNLILHC